MSVFDEIRNQLDIVQVISEYVELRKKGKNFIGLSPFQTENTPSFVVSPEKQIFKDFSSGNGGDVIKFIQLMEKKENKNIIGFIAKKYDLKLSIQVTPKLNKNKILDTTHQFYTFNLFHTKQGEEAINYLAGRSISTETMEKFKIGLALNGGLKEVLTNSNVTIRDMLDLHLIGLNQDQTDTYDLFTNRIIFPIEDYNSNIVGFGSRTYKQNDTRAKYINSSDSQVFNKSRVLYNLNRAKSAIKKNNFVIISEGYMDVIRLSTIHINNVVGIMGTGLTIEHINMIKQFTQNVVLLLDGDKPGQASAKKYLPMLRKQKLNVVNVTIPNEMDPDEFVIKEGNNKLYELISAARDEFEQEKKSEQVNDFSDYPEQEKDFFLAYEEPIHEIIKESNNPFEKNTNKDVIKATSKEYERIKKMLNNWEAMAICYAIKKPEHFEKLQEEISNDFFLIDPNLHEIYIEMKNYYVKETNFENFNKLINNKDDLFEYILNNKNFETTWQHVNSLLSFEKISEELLQRLNQTKIAYPYMRQYEMQLNNKKIAGSAALDLKITNQIRSIINKLKEITE